MRVPLITTAEWRLIAPHLPPTDGPGKPRLDDRRLVSAFFYAAACNCSLQSLPRGYPNPRSLQTRWQRWQADGTLALLMKAGEPVIQRMKSNYLNLIRGASIDRQNPCEFFGHGVIPRQPHLEPRGRYAGRRRRVPEG